MCATPAPACRLPHAVKVLQASEAGGHTTTGCRNALACWGGVQLAVQTDAKAHMQKAERSRVFLQGPEFRDHHYTSTQKHGQTQLDLSVPMSRYTGSVASVTPSQIAGAVAARTPTCKQSYSHLPSGAACAVHFYFSLQNGVNKINSTFCSTRVDFSEPRQVCCAQAAINLLRGAGYLEQLVFRPVPVSAVQQNRHPGAVIFAGRRARQSEAFGTCTYLTQQAARCVPHGQCTPPSLHSRIRHHSLWCSTNMPGACQCFALPERRYGLAVWASNFIGQASAALQPATTCCCRTVQP
jgi:hypothetical protein